MSAPLERITAILGGIQHAKEASEILDEAIEVTAWREDPYQDPFTLAVELAHYHVEQRNKAGVVRRYRIKPL